MPNEPDKEPPPPEKESEAENERPTVSPPFDPIAFAKEILSTPSAAGIPAMRTAILAGHIDLNVAAAAAAATDENDDPHTHATPPQGTEQQTAAVEASRRSGAFKSPADPNENQNENENAKDDGDEPSNTAETRVPPAAPVRRKTPTSTISLANARIPSNLPPRLDSPSTPISVPEPPAVPGTAGPQKLESLSSMNAVDREWADMEIATRPPPADSPYEDPVLEIMQDRSSPKIDLESLDDDADDEDDAHGADTVRRPIPPEILNSRAATGPTAPPNAAAAAGGGGPASAAPVSKGSEREMNDRVSLGDYSGALEIAEKILNDNPDDPGAKACADNCRTVLRQMYAARIGPLDRVPIVMVPRDQLRWLSIDHKAGFVLSLVDGVSSLEMIIDVSGMPELDTLRILSELAQQRIISLRT